MNLIFRSHVKEEKEEKEEKADRAHKKEDHFACNSTLISATAQNSGEVQLVVVCAKTKWDWHDGCYFCTRPRCVVVVPCRSELTAAASSSFGRPRSPRGGVSTVHQVGVFGVYTFIYTTKFNKCPNNV